MVVLSDPAVTEIPTPTSEMSQFLMLQFGELSTLMARKQKLGLQTDSLITDKLNFSITSVDNITDKNKISQFVNNMPARDSLVLRRFLDNNEPGIDMNVTMKCTSCFEESYLKLPLGVSFFWPDQ